MRKIYKLLASLIIFFLILNTSCSVMYNTVNAEIGVKTKRKKLAYIHTKNSIYLIDEVWFDDEHIGGKVIPETKKYLLKNKILDIYVAPESVISIEDGKIAIPKENVGKVEKHQLDYVALVSTFGIYILIMWTLSTLG